MTLPFEAQLGIAALVIGVLLIGAGTKKFGRLWVFGWTYDAKEREAEEWKKLYLEAIQTVGSVAEAAKRHTSLSSEEAEMARRIIREAGRGGRGENDEKP